MDDIFIDKYKDFWVLASQARTKDKYSPFFAVPPVRIIPHSDKEGLKAVLLQLFTEKVRRIPRPDLNDPDLILGIKPKAFNLKSPRTYLKDARAFYLQRTEDRLTIEEWTQEKGGWHAEPLWREEFKITGLDELIEYLIERTKDNQ
jgi:hypothetical protein